MIRGHKTPLPDLDQEVTEAQAYRCRECREWKYSPGVRGVCDDCHHRLYCEWCSGGPPWWREYIEGRLDA